jgi:class 3 adenylate cyclase/predicted ATPase
MIDDIGQLLDRLGLGKHAHLFVENEIDIATLPYLSEDDLKELGLPMGPRKRLLAAVTELAPAESESTKADAATREAERRQLTVMFVDLVDSTGLSAKLDPEDLREVIHRYQNTVAGEVSRYEGHVAKFMGDGVLVYFGYPLAHEDEAERAVRAGLGIVAALGHETVADQRLEVRIGVATGQVIVGDLVGEGAAQEEAVVGETPNLAARLQELAAPGSVIVAQASHDLLGGLFEVEDLGARKLKGFSEPVGCWRVLGERIVESRFEAARGAMLSRLVGRGQEVALLEERWRRARDGEGQVVLLSGEAGIGKSRLTRALMELIADQPHTRLRYQCSAVHANSALHPFIAQLERAAGFAANDGATAKRAKLDSLLRRAADDVSETMPFIASLLSLPPLEDLPVQEFDPQQRKQRTLEALLSQLDGLAARQPVLMFFEDAQWADPTSLELLEQTIGRVERARVLAVITGRREFRPGWPDYSHVTKLTLNRLGRRQGAEIVADLTHGKALPKIVLDQIVAKTDGVPLFVEELAKTVLESGLLEDAGDHFVLKDDLTSLAIPSTLQDSLMARLDRLAPVKEVAQIGAAIGREFPHRLLAGVSSLNDDEAIKALDRLVESELLFRRGNPPDATYIFKHSLVQDTAYRSLLREKRQAIHQRIAAVLQEKYPGRVETEPEVLAHHLTEGGLIEKAIRQWQRAGQYAAEHSADAEARQHLQKALKLLEDSPESPERRERELETSIVLGPVLMNLKGSASPDVRDVYLRARDLCDRAGEPAQRFPVLWGLWLHHHIAGQSTMALGLAHEAIELAESLSNEDFLLQAHHATWTTQEKKANFGAVLEHADQGMALYNVDRHRAHAFTYGGHDPGVCSGLQGANAAWFLGYPDQALRRIIKALELAKRVAHTFSTAQALATTAQLHMLRREPERAIAEADELIAFSTENGLILWRANGQLLRSWAISEMGDAASVLDDFRDAIQLRKSAGSQIRLSLNLAQLAHALARAGEIEEAQTVIGQALIQLEKTGERTWESIVHWVRGEIFAAVPEADLGSAEACYLEACEIARRQMAKSMELRAAASLARLWSRQGRVDDALKLLAPVYGWFTEGFDTPDLTDAKALLDNLS